MIMIVKTKNNVLFVQREWMRPFGSGRVLGRCSLKIRKALVSSQEAQKRALAGARERRLRKSGGVERIIGWSGRRAVRGMIDALLQSDQSAILPISPLLRARFL
jgi:hypothetical protein